MVPVYQRYDDDCLRACVASILELQLTSVPHFVRKYKWDWFEELTDFMLVHGYDIYWTPKWKWDDTGNYSIGYGRLHGWFGWEHNVVCYNGVIVHDPSREYSLKRVPYYINLESV